MWIDITHNRLNNPIITSFATAIEAPMRHNLRLGDLTLVADKERGNPGRGKTKRHKTSILSKRQFSETNPLPNSSVRYADEVNSHEDIISYPTVLGEQWLVNWLQRERYKQLEALLEDAAKLGNQAVFLDMLKEVEWQERSPSEFTKIIDLALEAGAHLAARQIATKGAAAHSENTKLQKYARVLAPPKIITARMVRNVNQTANVEWLNTHKSEYKGQWVAIKDGVLLVAKDSLEAVRDQIGETNGRGILTTIVH